MQFLAGFLALSCHGMAQAPCSLLVSRSGFPCPQLFVPPAREAQATS